VNRLRSPALQLHAVLLGVLLLGSCRPGSGPAPVADAEPGGGEPVVAVAALNAHLQANDLAAFARAALPPALYPQLAAAWEAGQTRWPLDELPLSSRHANALAVLAAEGSRAQLLSKFDAQLAGAGADLRRMAELLTIFALEFIQQQDGYSASEREHYRHLLSALGQWAASAPLSERSRAEKALDALIPAAQETGLTTDAAFAGAGMEAALKRLTPLVAAGKQALALYGLDLDAALRGMQLQIIAEAGERAQVRMRYRLAGNVIDATIPMRRIDGRWYVADFVDDVTAISTAFAPPSAEVRPASGSTTENEAERTPE